MPSFKKTLLQVELDCQPHRPDVLDAQKRPLAASYFELDLEALGADRREDGPLPF
jgi:hypothetical protein